MVTRGRTPIPGGRGGRVHGLEQGISKPAFAPAEHEGHDDGGDHQGNGERIAPLPL